MAQFRAGKASVVQGQQAVTFQGATLLGVVIAVGNLFSIASENVWYEIQSVTGSGGDLTQVVLKTPYAGATKADASFAIHTSFSPGLKLPTPDYGDTNSSALLKQSLSIMDTALAQLGLVTGPMRSTPSSTLTLRKNVTSAFAEKAGIEIARNGLPSLTLYYTGDEAWKRWSIGSEDFETGRVAVGRAPVAGEKLAVAGDAAIDGNLIVGGNLTVNGDTLTIDVANLEVEDPVITIGRGNTAAAASFLGLKAERGASDAFWVWEESTDRWAAYTSSNDLTAKTLANIQAATIYGALSGNATTATTLQTARTLAISGAGTGSISFNGSANVTIPLVLADSGVGAGTFTKITVNAKGLAVSGGALASLDVTTALGFTPYYSADAAVANVADKLVLRDAAGDFSANVITAATVNATTFIGTFSGTATAAGRWATARTLTLNTDVSGAVSIDGSANVTLAVTLANSGVTSGTYSNLVVDAKGRVTGARAINSADVTTGLGFTPFAPSDAANLNTASKLVQRDASGNFAAGMISANLTGNVSGNATTATTLATARNIAISGDGTGTASFNGSANTTIVLTLANTAIVAGTYSNITVDAKGRLTAARAINSADVTAGLGYTPLNTAGGVISGNLTVSGDLLVQGTLTQVNTAVIEVDDPIMVLAKSNSTATAPYVGIKAERGGTDAFWVWNETNDRWTAYTSVDDMGTGTFANVQAATFYGALSGNASTASSAAILTTARTISVSGDATGGISFNGSANVAIPVTLADTGVTAAVYSNLTVDSKGRVTAARAINSSDVTTGLGFTPVQQGGGTAQGTNKLYIGWATGSRLRLQVDSTDFADVWPIHVSGNATTATSATSATTATKLATARTISGVSFDGSANITLTTTNIGEGTNQYFTNARARAAFTSGNGISIDAGTGVISVSASSPVLSVAGRTGDVVLTAADIGGLTTALAGYAQKAVANTFTSNQTIQGSWATLYLQSTGAAEGNQIIGLSTTGQTRWVIRPGNQTAESTGNVGSDFSILRYSDAGTYIDDILTITRSNGKLTYNGDIDIAATKSLSFGSVTRQMLNLYATTYGIGVQTSAMYMRANGGFAFFKGGVHSATLNDPGAGGTLLLDFSDTQFRYQGNSVFHAGSAAGSIPAKMIKGISSGNNIVPNSSFEDGADNWVLGASGSVVTIATASEGGKCLQASTSASPAAASTDYIPVEAGQRYALTGFIQGDTASANGAYLRILWYTSALAAASTNLSDTYSNGAITTSWVRVGGTAAAPSDAKFAKINLYHVASSTAVNCRFDALKFSRVIEATDFSPTFLFTGTPGAPTAATATNTTQIATTAFVQANMALKASLNGAIFTGDLQVDSALGVSGSLGFRTAGVQSWYTSRDATSKHFTVNRYNDAGTYVDTPFVLSYATGQLILNQRPAWGGLVPWDNGNFNPAAYALLSAPTFTGRIVTANIAGLMAVNDSSCSIQIHSAPTATGDGNLAMIGFYALGGYAIKMGVRADGYFGIGGWSRPAWSFYTDPSGNVIAAGNITAYSDPRLKDDVSRITGALDIVEQLDGVRFKWNHKTTLVGRPGERDIGVLADQVEAVLPEIVNLSIPDEANDGERWRTVAYDKLVPVLIEAIKELNAKVRELETRQ